MCLWDRGDSGVEEASTEIGNQRSEKRRIEQARFVLPVGRPVGGGGGRSTGVHNVHKVIPIDCPVDRGRERSTGLVDRLTSLSSRLGPVDQHGRLWHGPVD